METNIQDNLVTVIDVRHLPYIHIPFSSVEQARARFPNDTLYVYEGKVPGWRIVAVSIVMHKPKKEESNG